MNSALWTQISAAFGDLVDLSPAERALRLNRYDPDVRRGVEGLLSAHDSAGGFLEHGGEQVPVRLGPYRLTDKIGEGGMGVVYRAVRDDGEFRRAVAIKVVGGRLLAWEAERRFIQERQILARLDHPNIVRMLDGGVSDGRRYLVMEFVQGEPLTTYCIQRNLPLPARLRLFCDAAAAVRCAHQNLIIHRDLKANNVLVTEEGVVKVLDFGIAQLLDAGEDAPAGQTGLNPWTPGSASPEQIMGAPLTVATDIYSLGVMLYELLTGVNPQWSPGERADETITRICERDPKTPSSIHRAVPGDLDAIVLRALAKKPQDRFGSVEEFRADVQRFLEGRPVLAQAPSAAYRLRKLIGRNRLLSAVSAGLTVAVLAGLGAFAWETRLAERQRVLAERRFNEARRLIRTVIHDIQPKMGAIPGTASLRKDLIDSTLAYLEVLTRDAAGNPELMRELAASYIELASIQGIAQTTNLGDPASAGRTLERARALAEQLLLLDGDSPASLELAILCDRKSADLRQALGDDRKAEEHSGRAVLRSEKLAALKPGDLGARKVLATSLLTEARVKGSLTRWRQALDAHESLLAAHSDPELLRNTALIHKYLSGWYLSTDEVQKRDYQKALEHALKAAEIDEKRLAADPQHPQTQLDLAIDLSQVGSSYEALGDLRNAFVHMQRSAGIRERVVQANPDDARARDRLAWALNQQAYYRRRLGDPTRALADFRRVISIYEGLYARKAINDQMVSGYAYSHFEVGDLLKQAGKPADACTHYLKSVHLYAEREKMRSFSVFELQNVKLARAAAAACAAR